MAHMNVLLPKLFIQALRQRSQSMFTGRERARDQISPNTGRSSSENQSPPRASWLRSLVFFERHDRLPRKGKSSFNVDLQGLLDIGWCYFQERLPNPMRDVPNCGADRIVGRRIFGLDCSPGFSDVLRGVCFYGESGRLRVC
jgi:hypothetical protein